MKIETKLLEIQQKLNVPKGNYNDFGNFSYRSCEDILEAIKPLLKEQKTILIITDDMVEISGRFYVKATAILRDCESDEMVTNTAYAREEESKKGMDASQVTGSASSYARKICLCGLFCLDGAKDADTRDNRTEEAKAQAEDAKKTEQVGKEKISDVMATSLIKRCEESGVDVDQLCKLYKVKKVADLTMKKLTNIHENWDKISLGGKKNE